MMIPALWNENATAALVNHLWQSTAVVGIAWLLTLALRKNHAQARYWVWFAASVKFLLPFSLLIAAGDWLRSWIPALSVQPAVAAAMQQITQPFAPMEFFDVTKSPVVAHQVNLLPSLLVAIWLCGALSVVLRFTRGWWRVRAAVHAASPLDLAADVPVLSSRSVIEPGIFGIFRPVLLLPQGLLQKLTAEQLSSIVAHEMCHVRRHDNLTFALHMIVEAIFWFHPAAWWISARLIEERERACDEAVVQAGSRAEVYAEGILNVCKFYVESPLACIAGIAGADLKKRIARIMGCGVTTTPLNVPRKLLLGAAAALALALPVCFGLLHGRVVSAQGNAMQSKGIENTWRVTLHAGQDLHIAAQSNATSNGSNASQEQLAFDVVSIRRNKSPMGPQTTRIAFPANGDGLTMTDVSLSGIVATFYGFGQDSQSGMPDWANSECYDIQAKVAESGLAAYHKLSRDQRIQMAQAILRDRFKLRVHVSQKEASLYALTIAKNGTRLKEATSGETYTSGPPGPDGQNHGGSVFVSGDGELTGDAVTIGEFAQALRRDAGREVVDKTGLTGKYDFVFKWNRNENEGPSLFTALDEQLGLKLEPTKGMVRTLVIDNIERPSAN